MRYYSVEVLEHFSSSLCQRMRKKCCKVVSIFLPRDRTAPRIASTVCLMFLPNGTESLVVLILSENKFYYHELMLLFSSVVWCGDLFTTHLTLFELLGFQQQNYYFSCLNLKLLSHHIRSSDNRLAFNSAKQSRKSSNIRSSFISNQD